MSSSRIFRVALTFSALGFFALVGCKKESEQGSPAGGQPAAGPASAQPATQGADVAALRKKAEDLVAQIHAKQAELQALVEKLKAVPPADLLGPKGQELKKEESTLNKSITSLTTQLNQVNKEIKEKGGDTSGLTP